MDKRKKNALLSFIGTCIVLSALSFIKNFRRDVYKNANFYLSSVTVSGQSVELNRMDEDLKLPCEILLEETQGAIVAQPVEGWHIDKILTMKLDEPYSHQEIYKDNDRQCTPVENGETIEFGKRGTFVYIYLKPDKGFGLTYSMIEIISVETLEIDTNDWVQGETKIKLSYDKNEGRWVARKEYEMSYVEQCDKADITKFSSPEDFINKLGTLHDLIPGNGYDKDSVVDNRYTSVLYREENGKYYITVYKIGDVIMEVL